MAILGTIIQKAIELKAGLSSEVADFEAAQEAELRKLLERAKDTSFGKYYDFAGILETEQVGEVFRERVPIHDYQKMHKRWWAQQQQYPDITWPGKPQYFALSSATTGKKSKRIPVTDDMLAAFRSVSISQLEAISNFDLPTEFFEREVLMLGSSADLKERGDHLEGEISGINSSNIPAWFDSFYRPGPEIAAIDDWDERLAAIVQAAPEWNIGAICGIPSWVQMMLKAIIDHHGLRNIHELWPDLSVYVTGGVAFEPYRESFEALLERPLFYMDTYLASEGFFAYNMRPGTMAMRMAIEHGLYFEFVPFPEGFDEAGKVRKEARVMSIGEVEMGRDYALLASTPAGAWRYMIGDTVRFTNLEKCEIVISGRTKYFLNVVGSQLSENKINQAIKELRRKTGVQYNEFCVAALKDDHGDFYHQWILGADKEIIGQQRLTEELDAILQKLNKNYKVARSKALKKIEVRCIAADQFYAWLETRKKKGGQIKTPKVMPAEQMEDFLAFLGA